LEVVDSVLHPDGEGGVILIINTYDGLLQSEAPSSRTSLHLVFRLEQGGKREGNEGKRREKGGRKEVEGEGKNKMEGRWNEALPCRATRLLHRCKLLLIYLNK